MKTVQTGRIFLDGLCIEFFDDNLVYEDWGFFFGNLNAVSELAYKKLTQYSLSKHESATDNIDGRMIINKERTHAITFYKKVDPVNDMINKAHEQTHVLDWTGRRDLLEKRMWEEGLDIPLLSIGNSGEDGEYVASIGGFFSLQRYNPYGFSQVAFFPDAENYFKEAYSVMTQAIKKRNEMVRGGIE